MHRCIASESADESLVVLSVVIVQCESTFSVQFHLFHYVSVCFSIADLSRFHTWIAVSVDGAQNDVPRDGVTPSRGTLFQRWSSE